MIGLVVQPQKPYQLVKPAVVTITPNVGAAAELTSPSQNQNIAAVKSQALQLALIKTNTGVTSVSGPPLAKMYARPNSIGTCVEHISVMAQVALNE